jgi:hypothetical protein
VSSLRNLDPMGKSMWLWNYPWRRREPQSAEV